MDIIHKLEKLFTAFPGIGPRQAKRFVYFLLSQDDVYINDIAQLMTKIKGEVKQCESCFRFFQTANSNICDICSSPSTDKSTLLVIEKDVDFENIRKSGVYRGVYFILGGILPILEKEPAKKIRIKDLMIQIEKRVAPGELKEIILALSANTEGENTAQYVRKVIEPQIQKYSLKLSTLGRGLSTGTELEYSDDDTLKNALKNRS